MADIPGTNVASMITPFTTQDIIATHSETYGQGGYRSEKTVADMNAIIASRRKEGMIVHVLDEDKDYILKDGNFVVKTSEVIVDSALSTTSLNPVQNKVITNALDSKQNSLVSGTSIKTINSVSLLGSGNINIPVITVDSATSSTSTNPLQNRVITASITDINTKLTPISTAWNKKNTANGLLVLDTAGLVPSSNLPSYVDDVLDVYATYDQSATGTISNVKLYTDSSKTIAVVPETGKIYIDVSSGKPPYQFRWSGTAYVTLNTGGLIIGTISGTAFDGGKGQELYSEYAGSRKTIYQRAYSFFNAITPASDKFMQNISASYTATAISLTKAYKNFAGTSSSESLTINAATTSNAGVMSAADKTKLDSYQASTGATPNSIAKRDENGDLTMRYPITNAGVDNSSSIDYVVYISNSATKFMRHCSLSHFTDVMRLVTTTSRGLMSPADKKKLEDIDTEKFLRKDIDDIANGNITFNNGIYVKGSYANLQSIFEQGGNSILEQGENGIIETAETQAAPTDITLADLANVDGTVNEPAYKRMILTKLAGATTWTQEYIDPLIEITEAPSNNLYYARRNKAWVNFTPFSGNYSDLSGKPTIPTKLANPYALTFSGAVTATYDGSGAVNVNIPVGGGGGGGSVIVDSSLSTTSVNPVQNRVITNAINNANSSIQTNADNIEEIMAIIANIPSISIDTALSTTSLNPVQNKVITNALDSKQNSLVSGTSIKTINSVSLLGSGNINIPVITVDSATSSTSTNPLQNRVITASITDINTKLTPISTAWNKKNTANGLLVLDTAGLVPSSNLPSYVDDVLDVYATYDQSATGTISNVKLYTDSSKTIAVVPETGKIYIDVSSGKPPYQFRWSGTAYVTLNTGGLIIGTISGTAFDGGKGQELYSEYAGSRKTIYQRAYSFFNAITPASDKFMQNISASYTATAISLTKAYKNFAGTSSSESLTINAATTSNAGVMSAADKTKLDSYQASTGATPNSIAKRDENGDLTMRYPITNAGVDNSSSIDYVVYISNSATKFMRHCSLSHFTDVMRLVTTTSRGLMSPADKKKLEDIDTEKFLRKDIDDIANGNITFNNGIYVKGSYANLQSIFEQGGNSILEQGENGIIETAETQAAPTDITLADLANVDGTVNEPAYKRMILTKLAGATTWTQEYIDPLIEITEAPSNNLYYARRNKAWVNFTPFSGNYSDLSGKPTIPTKLANPYALTFSGAVTATYDGSGAVNVNIPVGGGGGGGSVIVDSSLSTTSVNPVQNRVITNAINNANSSIQTNADNIEEIMAIIANIPSISIDTALSTTSTNAVQNKVITAALNSKQNTLVSGTNIKTINSQSIVGSGNVNLTYSFSQITSKPTTLSGYGISDAYTMTQVNNAFVSLSGNVIRTSGKLSMAADAFADDGSTGGLDMRNSNIVGVNGIYFKDASDSDGEYINFYRDSTHVDSLYALNGELRFKPNRVLGAITTASNIILHTGNYTSYVPTKTGTGATGTWAISITGTAELSKATNLINGSYTGSGGKQPPSYIPSGKIRFNMMSTVVGTDSNYKDFILMDSYTGNDVPYVTAIGVRKTSTPEAYIMSGAKGNTTEANWVKTTLLSALNYNNYAPSKTGLGASGTWNINVSGSAASVAWVNVSNKPNFAAVATSGSYNDLTNKPTITNITVDSALSTTSTNPLQNKIITTALNGKQANLVSGTNIKTVGGQSLLGSGNIAFPTITVDSALSSTSTNPLQNKVINSQFESVTTGMQLIMSLYNEIKTSALTSSSVVTSITTENSNSTSLVTSVKSIVSYINDNLIVPITPLLTAYLAQNTKNGMLILDSNGKVPSNLLPGTLLTLGTTSTTAFRGDYGNILFTNFGSGTNLTGTQRARNFFGKIDVSNLHFLSGDYTWTQTDSEIEIEFEQYNFTGTKSTSSPLINFPIATTAKAGLLGGDQCSYLFSLNTEYNNIANKANYIKARKFFNSINPVNEYYYCGASVSPSKIDIEIEITKRNFDTSSEIYDYINLPAVTLNNAGILTSTQFTNLSNKQEKLVSGTSIKTINGQSLLGSGNINISGGGLNSYTTTLDIFNISNGRTITSTEFAEVGRIVTAVREGKQILYNYQMAEFGTGVLNCHLADDLTCLSWVVTSYTDTEIFYIDPTLSTDKWARISLVKSDFSNITSKSFGSSSSYYKLPDGLLIQWGYSTNSGIGKVIYYPISFFNTYYSVHLTGTRSVHSNYIYSFDIYTKSVSSFTMDSVYQNVDSDAGGFSIAFYWFAIGRWK